MSQFSSRSQIFSLQSRVGSREDTDSLHGFTSPTRTLRELRHGDEPIGGAGLDAVIVRTEVLDVVEAVAREQQTELFTLPTAHDELIIADALIAPPDKFVALGYQQEPALSIEPGDACEGQLPAIS
jgi:hypothetical protein